MQQDDTAAGDEKPRTPQQEDVSQSQKMEAVGRLAGGVAHDFNNILTAIQCYGRYLAQSFPADDRRREDAEEIIRACGRGAALTRQLLAFSRRQVLAPVVLDLNAVVRNLEKMLQRLIREDIRFVTRLDDGAGNVRMDPNQLEQVVLNLVVNARDAMPRGGVLTVETGLAVPEGLSGEWTALRVSDTGTGMDEATLKRIFEPFFTTKGSDHGTGLGLATVYGIVKQSGGDVRVESSVGRGSVFIVLLPRDVSPAKGGAAPLLLSDGPGLRGSETVLVVEDEPVVRAMARRSLAGFGYTVIEAVSAEQAFLLAGRHAGGIDLLLTDIVMTGMNGPELARRLSSYRPGIKSLFMSGYNDDTVFQNGMLEPGVPFLQKPFSPDELGIKVREALGPTIPSR